MRLAFTIFSWQQETHETHACLSQNMAGSCKCSPEETRTYLHPKSQAVYPLVVDRVNCTNYPGIRVSSLRLPEESLDMNTRSPQFLVVYRANPHVCVSVSYAYTYICIYNYMRAEIQNHGTEMAHKTIHAASTQGLSRMILLRTLS